MVVRMTTNAVWVKVDPERVVQVLTNDAVEKLAGAEDVVLDFSSVLRIDASAVDALEDLARLAGDRSANVALLGVNLNVYKVLKLVKLTPRFSFLP
jgi:anti-anti-sigma regulatory factor